MTADLYPTIALLENLTNALTSAAEAFPVDAQGILPPPDGISLLDVKNELLLSYLHNLVFLIILRLRRAQETPESEQRPSRTHQNLNDDVVRKLIELRVYIDRGVRPLESRLRYRIDQVIGAAEETQRIAARKETGKSPKQGRSNGTYTRKDGSTASASESDSDGSDVVDGVAEDVDEDEEAEAEETLSRPNAAAFPKIQTRAGNKAGSRPAEGRNGVYKPPRITPTSMPLPASMRDRDREDDRARRRKSNLLNEYIDEEVSAAPQAQPSIGSNQTILDRGRGGLSTKDREKQRERLEYEETNFVRLPGESKAERRKARQRGERDRRDMFGGEDWTGLGGLGDRINSNVQRRGGPGMLERREKRRRPTEDGPRGDGMGIGETFAKRQRVLEDRAERKRKKRG